jgi:TonB family protein
MPDSQEMQAYLPATARGRSGLAVIECVVTATGVLDRCAVRSEDPPGLGFGAAALALSSTFLMHPMTKDGVPVEGGKVVVPIHWIGAGGNSNDSGFRLRVLRDANWVATPTAEELRAAFPQNAVGKVPLGRATLRCEIENGGRLENCIPILEGPPNYGFERAAESLIKDFRIQIEPNSNRYGDLRVDVPFVFAPDSRPPQIYDPVWMRSPDPDDLAKAFPSAAAAAGDKDGSATLDCTVAHNGSLTDCNVVSETPTGLGFGAAALKVAAGMAMSPWTAQGVPVDGGHITLPIRLQQPSPPKP